MATARRRGAECISALRRDRLLSSLVDAPGDELRIYSALEIPGTCTRLMNSPNWVIASANLS